MQKYKAVLFAPEGDWTTDFKGETKEEVINQLANRGSRWFFYPFEGIILNKGPLTRGNQRLISVAPNMPQELLVGKSIKTMSRWIGSLSEAELHQLIRG